MKNFLAQYNIVPCKTYSFTIPENNIPEEFIYDFLRGLIDADGCIHIRKNRNNIPSLSFVSQVKECAEQVNRLLNFNTKISLCNEAYQIHKEGKEVLSILNKLYEHSTEKSRLRRKYEIYQALKDVSL